MENEIKKKKPKNIEHRFQGSVMSIEKYLKHYHRLVDYRDKAIFNLMWYGFKNDIDNWGTYTRDDLAQKGSKYYLKDKEIPFNVYDDFIKATVENTYHAISNKQSDDVQKLIESNYIVKETQRFKQRCRDTNWNGYGMTTSSMRNRYSTLRRYLHLDFAFSSLALSGLIREAYINTSNGEEMIEYLIKETKEESVGKELYKKYLKALPELVEDDYEFLCHRNLIEEYNSVDRLESEKELFKEEVAYAKRKSEENRQVNNIV